MSSEIRLMAACLEDELFNMRYALGDDLGGPAALESVRETFGDLYSAATATFQKPATGTQVGDFAVEPEQGGEAFPEGGGGGHAADQKAPF